MTLPTQNTGCPVAGQRDGGVLSSSPALVAQQNAATNSRTCGKRASGAHQCLVTARRAHSNAGHEARIARGHARPVSGRGRVLPARRVIRATFLLDQLAGGCGSRRFSGRA